MMAADLKKVKLHSKRLLQQAGFHGGIRRFIKVYKRGDTPYTLVSTNGCVLQLLSDDKVQVTVRCKQLIQDACLSGSQSSEIHLFVLSASGNVYVTSLPSKSSLSRSDSESGSIFDDLLEGEVTVNSAIELKEEDKLFDHPGAKKLGVIGDKHLYVVTYDQEEALITVRIHRWNKGRGPESIATYYIDTIAGESTDSNTESTMYFVCPADCAVPIWNNAEHIWLDRSLFGQLFGGKYGLLETPMVLLGLPSGQIYAAPIHPPMTDHSPPQADLLCDLQQAVVNLFSMELERDNSNSKSRLCIIGRSGKVLLLSHSTTATVTAEYYVSGPVIAALNFCTDMVHTIGSQYLVTDLTQVRGKEVHSHLKSEMFQAGLTISVGGPLVTEEGRKEWLSITRPGHVYKHCLSLVSNADPVSASSNTSKHASLKDLLTGISQSAEQLQIAQQNVAEMDSILKQVALASYAATNVRNNSQPIGCKGQEKESSTSPFQLRMVVNLKDLGPETTAQLSISFINKSDVVLTNGWSLSVVISARCKVNGGGFEWSGNSSRTISLVNGLVKGQHQDFVIPLSHDHLRGLPLLIEGYVTYNPICEHLTSNPVTIPLTRHTIDVIHFLGPHQSGKVVKHLVSDKELVINLAKNRPCWNLLESKTAGGEPSSNTGHFSMKVIYKEKADSALTKSKSKAPETQLFKYVLADSNLNISEDLTCVTATCAANGCSASISVNKTKGELLEICWSSDDMVTMNWLHSAVIGRLEAHEGYTRFLTLNRWQAKYEELAETAQSLRDKTCEFDCDWNRLAQDTIALYRKLRNTTT